MEFMEILHPYIMSFLELLATAIAAMALVGVRHGIKWLKARSHAEAWQCAMTKLGDVTRAAVAETEQTFLKELRKTKKHDAEQLKEAQKKTMASAREQLGTRGLAELKACLGLDDVGLERMIITKIEHEVSDSKKDISARMIVGGV